jgi:thioredoxin reductase (NADPH)
MQEVPPMMNSSGMDTDRKTEAGVRAVDCLIVGGGAAGLSAAVNLGRMRRDVLLVDARDRFLWSHVIHNYLGFPDGISALEIRRRGWQQAARYGVELLIGQVVSGHADGDAFVCEISRLPEGGVFAGRPGPIPPRDPEMARIFSDVPGDRPMVVRARTLLLATGVMGHFPDFPGRDECVGRSLFWCIHCDGYESSDRVVGVVGCDEEAAQTALDMLDFTSHVTLVAGRAEGFELPESRLADLAANDVAAFPVAVAEYRSSKGQMRALVLADEAHTVVPVEHVYAVQRSRAVTGLARALNVALDAAGQIAVDAAQETSVRGVFAAGDVTSPHNHQLSAAVHEGNEAACAINYRLYRPVQKDPRDA